MKKYHCYSAQFDIDTEKLFREGIFLGQGNNGIVYKLPEKKVIKIFIEKKVCRDESYILLRAKGSDYFPNVTKHGELYIVRDMVEGVRLDKYIRYHGLSSELVKNICNMLNEFKRLKFLKIDFRCKDVYVGYKEKLMMIDPKQYYKKQRNYPRHFMKGLSKIGALDDFFLKLKEIDEKKAKEWKRAFEN